MNFTIRDFRLHISFFFLAALTFLLLTDRDGVALHGLLAAMIHESGHLLAMLLLRTPPAELRLCPFGIEIVKRESRANHYIEDAVISLAGPCANAVACAVFLSLGQGENVFFAANFLLAVLNLLPIEPLDGGQTLFSFLCLRHPLETAGKVIEVVSFVTLLPLSVLGFVVLVRSQHNFSLLLAACYMMALLMLKKGRCYQA